MVSFTSARMIFTRSAFGGSVYAGTIQPRSADSCHAMSDSSYVVCSPESRKATSGSCSSSAPITSKRPLSRRLDASAWAFCCICFIT